MPNPVMEYARTCSLIKFDKISCCVHKTFNEIFLLAAAREGERERELKPG